MVGASISVFLHVFQAPLEKIVSSSSPACWCSSWISRIIKYVLGQRISERRVDKDATRINKILRVGDRYCLSFCGECSAGNCKRAMVCSGCDPATGADDMDWIIPLSGVGRRLSGKVF